MASGSHTYSGICALLPMQPRKMHRHTSVAMRARTGSAGVSQCTKNVGSADWSSLPIGQICTLAPRLEAPCWSSPQLSVPA